jgi:hypothetical protein
MKIVSQFPGVHAVFHALGTLFATRNVHESRGVAHAAAVLRHAQAIVESNPALVRNKYNRVSLMHEEAIELSAILHHADDPKYFANANLDNDNLDYTNAHRLVTDHYDEAEMIWPFVESILLRMTQSERQLHEVAFTHPWQSVARDADLLEHIGLPGLRRAFVECCVHGERHVLAPRLTQLYCDEALLLEETGTRARFGTAISSKTLLDHYYDRLLYVGKLLIANSNAYVALTARWRHRFDIDFCLAAATSPSAAADDSFVDDFIARHKYT